MDTNKYIISESPNWQKEACLALHYGLKEGTSLSELFNHHDSFGKTRKELEELFDIYLNYEQCVLEEVRPLLDKNSHLKGYFETIEIGADKVEGIALMIQSMCTNTMLPDIKGEELKTFIKQLILNGLEGYFDEEETIDSLGELINIFSRPQLDIPDRYKWLFINLYNEPEIIYSGIRSLVIEAVKIVKKYFPIIEKEYYTQLDEMKHIQYYRKLLDGQSSISYKAQLAVTVEMSILGSNSLAVMNHEQVHVGMYFYKLSNWKEAHTFIDTQMVKLLKALADASRIKIMKLISQKPMYLQEIANEMGLTPATVSHHLDILLNNRLIRVVLTNEKGRKVFYEPDAAKLDQLAGLITQLK